LQKYLCKNVTNLFRETQLWGGGVIGLGVRGWGVGRYDVGGKREWLSSEVEMERRSGEGVKGERGKGS